MLESDVEYLKKYLPADKLEDGIKRLKNGEAVQYIIGNVEFYNSIIKVNKNVLIPRFETELLVDKTINYLKEMIKDTINIIDLGTGSGCIAIALKKELNANVTAVDISDDALQLAKENAIDNNLEIEFIKHDITSSYSKKFDCIISNPPYIPIDGYVEDIVKNNEPHIALFAKDNGLFFYKKILEYADKMLNKKSLIAFEIGDNQKELLEEFLKNNYSTKKYSFEKDLTGRYRYLFIFNE